jgi:hypothetical protein
MNHRYSLRNVKLQKCFWSGHEYSSNKDNRSVKIESINNKMEIQARLHKNVIAKRCNVSWMDWERADWDPDACNETMYISYAGWKTRTTSMAIAALLPSGWRYLNGHVLSPKGVRIEIPVDGYLKLIDPIIEHEQSWNCAM